MLIIQYPRVYKALDNFVDNYNEYQESCGKIKSSVLLTAKEIIRVYGASLLKTTSLSEIAKNREKIPPLRTNNVQLAKLTKSSSRTIQRHLKRLEEAGIITGKSFKGTNGGYELLVNPDILLISPKKTVDSQKSVIDFAKKDEAENQLFKKVNTTKCPHTYPSNNRYFNNTIIDVDRNTDPSLESEKLEDINNQTGNVTGNITGNAKGKTGEKIEDAKGKAGEWVEKTNQKEDSARSASLATYVSLLWNLAQNTLYREVPLTDNQVKVGKDLLYKWYEPVADKHLAKIHQQYCERIEIVRKYVEKSPKTRFVPFPYQFFDPENATGFTATKVWRKEQQKKKVVTRKKLILKAQIRKYTNNLLKPAHLQRSSLEVFREAELRISKLKDRELLEQFYRMVITPEGYTKLINHKNNHQC